MDPYDEYSNEIDYNTGAEKSSSEDSYSSDYDSNDNYDSGNSYSSDYDSNDSYSSNNDSYSSNNDSYSSNNSQSYSSYQDQ
ncbi:MAG: hypothetical protein VW298_00755, partial [Candidatus Woesearchaeota archaeon]